MRTTVDLDEDAESAVREPRGEGRSGSEAVIGLIRRGPANAKTEQCFTQRTEAMGAQMDVSNVADVLETFEGPDHR